MNHYHITCIIRLWPTLMEDLSVCPPCFLTDMGAELKKPNVSLHSNDQARLCSPRNEGNWKGEGEKA